MDQEPFIVREVALRADDTVLELLSHIPSLWSLLKPELESQFFWYQRTAEAFDLPARLEWINTSSENWHQIYNILIATRQGNPFPIRIVGQSPRPTVLDLNEYNLVAVKLLLEWGYIPTRRSMTDAAEYGSLQVLQLLLEDKEMDSDMLSDLMNAAASTGKLDMLQFLLTDTRTQHALDEHEYTVLVWAFEVAILRSQVPAANLLLREMESRDIDISKSDSNDLLISATERSSPETIQFLIDESLFMGVGDRDWVEHGVINDRPDLFLMLVGDNSPFEYLKEDEDENVARYLLKRTRAPIRSASKLSGLTTAEILDILSVQTNNNFNKYHFEMLLREIVTVQADLDYYLSWLTRTIDKNIPRFGKKRELDRKKEENRSTSLLLLSCIDSISTPFVVHTSDYFTAYSAFFLLANSKDRDVQAALRTIESEQGVTKDGLLKARLLLGAYDGRAR